MCANRAASLRVTVECRLNHLSRIHAPVFDIAVHPLFVETVLSAILSEAIITFTICLSCSMCLGRLLAEVAAAATRAAAAAARAA